MELLPISKIHRLQKSGVPFKNWIENEKQLFERKKSDGRSAKVIKDMDFKTFLNRRHNKMFKNASGSPLSDILMKTAEKLSDNEPKIDAEIAKSINEPVKKTILGMKPIVFYGVTGAVLIVTGVLIYKLMKK